MLINFNLPVSRDTETVARTYNAVLLKCYELKILIAKKTQHMSRTPAMKKEDWTRQNNSSKTFSMV